MLIIAFGDVRSFVDEDGKLKQLHELPDEAAALIDEECIKALSTPKLARLRLIGDEEEVRPC